MTKKMWEGRFTQAVNEEVEKFTASISFDKRLYPYDIAGSLAHVQMLAKQKIISLGDFKEIIKGLQIIKKELDRGVFKYQLQDEDIHMAVERRLHEIIGSVAGKLHTARSRNDQVILDVRLYLRVITRQVQNMIYDLQNTLLQVATNNQEIICPGFTHMQHAQPVLLAHYYLAYFQMLERDYQRLEQTYDRINVLPLGAGAMSGTNFPIDRHYVAELLDFPKVSENSMDTVADRDFVLDFLSASAILQMHLSRLAEEIVYWASLEFGFIQLPDEYCTGSSIMPQKKNPDVAELIRGKTGRIYGNMLAVFTTMKGLPLTYNSDMQEDKPPLFDTIDQLIPNLKMMKNLIGGIQFKKERIREMAGAGYIMATHLANYLSQKGVPFREAHNVVGTIVKYCEENKQDLESISLVAYQKFHPQFDKDLYKVLALQYSVDSMQSYGGTGKDSVRKMLKAAAKLLISRKLDLS